MTLLIMIGNLTPPVGMCLFAVSSFSKVNVGTLSIEVLPHLLGILIVTILCAYYPGVSTSLSFLIK
jgi:TRAP-type C4-dicarboxylate transport system permease large subunit